MALGFRGAGPLLASASGYLGIAPVPALEDTDISFLVLGLKACTVILPPVGWVLLAQLLNGSVADTSPDGGAMRVMVYVRSGVVTTTNFQVTEAIGSSTIGRIYTYTRAPDELYQWDFTTGADAVNNANYSANGDDNLLAIADDLLLAFTALNSDEGTRTAPLITAAGLSINTPTVRSNDQSTVFNDSGLMAVDALVTSGVEVGPPVFTFTNPSTSSGATVMLRLRRVSPTIEVLVVDPFTVKVGYEITVAGLTGFSEFEVQRVDTVAGTGTEVVRGGGRQTLSGQTTAVTQDYEFRFRSENGTPTVYKWNVLLYLNGKLQGTVSSLTRTPAVDVQDTVCYDYHKFPFAWIKSCTTPLLNQPVSIGEFDAYERAGRVLGKHNVIGRSNPVVITDVLGGSEGTFTVLVDAESHWLGADSIVKYSQDLRLLFETGSTYYFQTLDPFSAGMKDFYFSVETVSIKRESRIVGVEVNPTLTWTIKFVEVDRPGTLDASVSTRTWNSVLLSYTSWHGVHNSNDLWLDVLLGD